MAKPVAAPTERELEILKILWHSGAATVREVYETMRATDSGKDLAQNTVQTFLRMMEDKGLVEHKIDGRAFVYKPLYSRERTVSRFLHRVFDGAVDELVTSAFRAKRPSAQEIAAIERMIAQAKKQQDVAN